MSHQYDKVRKEVEAEVLAERSYHQSIVTILEKLYSEMVLEVQVNESSLQPAVGQGDVPVPSEEADTTHRSIFDSKEEHTDCHFIGKVY